MTICRSMLLKITLSALSVLVFSGSQTVEAARLDGSDPSATGCSRDAKTVRSVAVRGPGGRVYGEVQLRYSRKCRTAWARVVNTNLPACVTGDAYCSTAKIVRNSDGLSFECALQNGAKSCYTKQVNDSGVTSYAEGCLDGSVYWPCDRTGSY